MKLIKKILCFSLALPLTVSASPHFDLQDGGDLIQCHGTDETQLSGLFSLDYVTSYAFLPGTVYYAPAISWENSKKNILAFLRLKAPRMAMDFKQFTDQAFNRNLIAQTIWFGIPNSMLAQQNTIVHAVPEECTKELPNGNLVPDIYQAIVREDRENGRTIFHYDSRIVGLNPTIQFSGLNYSFVMVHEWLRTYNIPPHLIAYLNNLFHTPQINNYSDKNFQSFIEDLGISVSKDPNKQIRSVLIEEVDGKILFNGFGSFRKSVEKDSILEFINLTTKTIEIFGVKITPKKQIFKEVYEFFEENSSFVAEYRYFKVYNEQDTLINKALHGLKLYEN